jgi:glycosyltransferase involved in cell wall biosynthesis
MRIVQLTPGTGSFYCGTCLRDNALVAELCRQGHDAIMVPMYLPPTLDEPSAARGAPLFYGGVNVYLQQKSALFRHTPRWLDKLFDSPPLLKAAASKAGSTSASQLGDMTISSLRGEQGNQAKELERLVEWLETDFRPEVVCLSNVLLAGLARRIKERTGAPVVCTLQGEDTYLDALPAKDREVAWRTLAERCKEIDAFIAVSHYHGDLMRERIGLPTDKVHVVYNGISLKGYEPAPVPPDPPVLGYLARMYPPKGLETLIEAYIQIRKRGRHDNLKLRVAGSMTEMDKPFVEKLRGRLAGEGLEADAEFLPDVDHTGKIAFLRSLSVLSVPATYGESFGLYVIEAMAAGVPVVQPRHAAFPELIEATGGGILCEPNKVQALADGIEELLDDPEKTRALGLAGRQAVEEKFNVEKMAQAVMRVFEGVLNRSLTPMTNA